MLKVSAAIVLGTALSLLFVFAQESALQVMSENGNIFLVGTAGKRIQLSALGLDTDPTLSLDGQWIAFVRRTPNYLIETGHPALPD